ncbi:hypothetical protein Tco_1009590 [Tanacetum coccineum]
MLVCARGKLLEMKDSEEILTGEVSVGEKRLKRMHCWSCLGPRAVDFGMQDGLEAGFEMGLPGGECFPSTMALSSFLFHSLMPIIKTASSDEDSFSFRAHLEECADRGGGKKHGTALLPYVETDDGDCLRAPVLQTWDW